ncbi:hypothetical protein ACNFBR_20570 [Pseudomonas sp. NY11955]|uniref:hypothetical protein n=1 Tax=Pseudomonas sp. NY11955 TaxID=3400363 RepID=UPI003A852D7F
MDFKEFGDIAVRHLRKSQEHDQVNNGRHAYPFVSGASALMEENSKCHLWIPALEVGGLPNLMDLIALLQP